MIAHLDTNVLVRHLTGDPPAQARAAGALLDAASDLILEDAVVAELVRERHRHGGLVRPRPRQDPLDRPRASVMRR